MSTVLERVTKVAIDRLGVEEAQVTSAASFTEDLNADSLDLVELIMAMEEEFTTDENPIEISDEDAEGLKTVQDAVNFIKGRGIQDA